VNKEVESAPPEGLEEAPATAIEPPGRPVSRPEELRGADLRGQDLTDVEGLLPAHLAGADLTGAKLPDEIAKFPALGQVAAISSEARKIFIGLLAACVYSWLVIGTTQDVDLILNTASSPLPIINTPIPIAGFYVVGAILLAAVYCYLHFYLHHLWRMLATLPAVFPDGVALDDKSDPWPLTNFVRVYFTRLKSDKHQLKRLETVLSIALAWGLVPLTLFALWARYLPSHDWFGTCWLILLTGYTTVLGWHFFRFARAALRGETPPNGPGLRGTWRELRTLSWAERSLWFLVMLTLLILIGGSYGAFYVNPRDDHTWAARGLNGLRLLGIRTYADLREANLAERPDGWAGEDWSKVKRVDLRDRNLAFADATRAFLANADLRGANLNGAVLTGAQLQGAVLYDADRNRGVQLQGADLSYAQLQRADLSQAYLPGANLWRAQLQGANLRGAELQGAFLYGARLQGVDLSGTRIWRVDSLNALWSLADLRHSSVRPMTDPEIDALIGEATKEIPNEASRRGTAEVLSRALRSDERSPRPIFPEQWRSEPDVMFEPGDPAPEPFDWGPPRWATEQAYDEDLATYLGDLACAANAHPRRRPKALLGALSTEEIDCGGRCWPSRSPVPIVRRRRGCLRTCAVSWNNLRRKATERLPRVRRHWPIRAGDVPSSRASRPTSRGDLLSHHQIAVKASEGTPFERV
jgi:uncharacterized protein YjbI with pentapeptide repeats